MSKVKVKKKKYVKAKGRKYEFVKDPYKRTMGNVATIDNNFDEYGFQTAVVTALGVYVHQIYDLTQAIYSVTDELIKLNTPPEKIDVAAEWGAIKAKHRHTYDDIDDPKKDDDARS